MTEPRRVRVLTEPLGGSSLSLAIQRRELPAPVQLRWPASADEWKERARVTGARLERSWLTALAPAISARGRAAERLQRAAAQNGVVVTTGQQAALFGGPLYTLAKALTAIGLADELEEQLGVPVAPVFWAATDDADFREAASTYVADASGLHELRLETPPAAGTPMSLMTLDGAEMSVLVDRLRKACGSAVHAQYLEEVCEAFTQKRTLGDAYVTMLRALLEPLGMAVLDSSHAAYRQAALPTLMQAARSARAIADATSARAAAIRELGFAPQVDDERGLSLVYAIEDGVKRRLPVAEAEHLQTSRHPLAPNVLLRPVVEAAVLPTIAYVAGPAELAYFTQANAVAQVMQRDPLVAVTRWSCTVLEPFAERALERLGAEVQEIRDSAALERRLAMAGLPAGVAASWKRLNEELKVLLDGLAGSVDEASLVPRPVMEGLNRSLDHRLKRAERRLLAAVKRRDERVHADLVVAKAALFPLGQRQERALNFVPILTRGGPRLLEEMREAARLHARSLVAAEGIQAVGAR